MDATAAEDLAFQNVFTLAIMNAVLAVGVDVKESVKTIAKLYATDLVLLQAHLLVH